MSKTTTNTCAPQQQQQQQQQQQRQRQQGWAALRDRITLEDRWMGRLSPLTRRVGGHVRPIQAVVNVSKRAFEEVPLLIPSHWMILATRYIVMPDNYELTFRSVHYSETWEPWQWAMWGSTVACRFQNAVPTVERLGDSTNTLVSKWEWPSAMHQAWRDRAMASMRHHTPNGTVSTVYMGVMVPGRRDGSFFQTTVFGGPCSRWYKLAATQEEAISVHMAAVGVLSSPLTKRHKELLWRLTPHLPLDIGGERYSNPFSVVDRLAH